MLGNLFVNAKIAGDVLKSDFSSKTSSLFLGSSLKGNDYEDYEDNINDSVKKVEKMTKLARKVMKDLEIEEKEKAVAVVISKFYNLTRKERIEFEEELRKEKLNSVKKMVMFGFLKFDDNFLDSETEINFSDKLCTKLELDKDFFLETFLNKIDKEFGSMFCFHDKTDEIKYNTECVDLEDKALEYNREANKIIKKYNEKRSSLNFKSDSYLELMREERNELDNLYKEILNK